MRLSLGGMSSLTTVLFAVFLTTGNAILANAFSDSVDEVFQFREIKPVGHKQETNEIKRAMAFFPMRGRREHDEKRASSFFGLPGKKDEDKRASGFFGMRGKKDSSIEDKRASSFFGLRGKKVSDDKRASSFFGLRGKKDMVDEKRASSFFGLRGKKGSEWEDTRFLSSYPKSDDYKNYLELENQEDVDDYIKNLKQAYIRNHSVENGSYPPGNIDIESKRAGAFFGMRGKRSTKQDDQTATKEE
ncbi:uncharacterized protein LOC111087395 isoform X2 [Limulus polyphemus]|uniref:Uncharacterized protein LOC111087395 isoform X2 n=1 Tax=Limulus polyphemus TaxID=6850 RepID=A0ABM1T141_LIMPO|nr:uncharacterized protein LOC111087395 isoform X2 [Limulus polyphemus]